MTHSRFSRVARFLALALGHRMVAATMILLLASSPVIASHIAYKPTTIIAQWRATGSYYGNFTMYIKFSWNSTAAANVRAEAATGRRYTQDQRDINLNVTASGPAYSNFPNPVFDTDDDNGDTKLEESEVTADSTTFPTAGTGYYFQQRWDHNYWADGFYEYYWDPDSGYVRHHAQLSNKPWFSSEWDSWSGHSVKVGADQFYPYVAQQSSAAAAPIAAPVVSSSQATSDSTAPDLEYSLLTLNSDTVLIRPAVGTDLRGYGATIGTMAAGLLRDGNARAVATFARPLGDSDLDDLIAKGLTIIDVEAVGFDAAGDRMSAASPYRPNVVALLRANTDDGANLDGVVSANVIVSSVKDLRRLMEDARVFLIDPTIEDYHRRTGTKANVLMNDLYWQLAGWE